MKELRRKTEESGFVDFSPPSVMYCCPFQSSADEMKGSGPGGNFSYELNWKPRQMLLMAFFARISCGFCLSFRSMSLSLRRLGRSGTTTSAIRPLRVRSISMYLLMGLLRIAARRPDAPIAVGATSYAAVGAHEETRSERAAGHYAPI